MERLGGRCGTRSNDTGRGDFWLESLREASVRLEERCATANPRVADCKPVDPRLSTRAVVEGGRKSRAVVKEGKGTALAAIEEEMGVNLDGIGDTLDGIGETEEKISSIRPDRATTDEMSELVTDEVCADALASLSLEEISSPPATVGMYTDREVTRSGGPDTPVRRSTRIRHSRSKSPCWNKARSASASSHAVFATPRKEFESPLRPGAL